jgi:hypothetical protein
MEKSKTLVPVEEITGAILVVRGHRVILDSDQAAVYGVNTGRLNKAVKRNIERFPQDFMLRLSGAEYAVLISHIATSKPGRGGRRKLPWAFTEHAQRFPADFMFQLTAGESSSSRSQFATLKLGRGEHRKY